jgi:hypothetical protein
MPQPQGKPILPVRPLTRRLPPSRRGRLPHPESEADARGALIESKKSVRASPARGKGDAVVMASSRDRGDMAPQKKAPYTPPRPRIGAVGASRRGRSPVRQLSTEGGDRLRHFFPQVTDVPILIQNGPQIGPQKATGIRPIFRTQRCKPSCVKPKRYLRAGPLEERFYSQLWGPYWGLRIETEGNTKSYR